MGNIQKKHKKIKKEKEKEFENKEPKKIKIVLYGASGVGCNNLAITASGGKFSDHYKAVINWSYRILKFEINNERIEVFLWNGPGQEKFRELSRLFFNNTDIVVFVYEIIRKESFNYLDTLIKLVNDSIGNTFKGAIIGNKSDLFQEEQVTEREAEEYALKNHYKFCLTSAKTNPKGFRDFLEELVKERIEEINGLKK